MNPSDLTGNGGGGAFAVTLAGVAFAPITGLIDGGSGNVAVRASGDGGHVIVTVKGVGTTKSGNELTGDSIWLYKVDDGKIEHAEFYGDTATAVKALA